MCWNRPQDWRFNVLFPCRLKDFPTFVAEVKEVEQVRDKERTPTSLLCVCVFLEWDAQAPFAIEIMKYSDILWNENPIKKQTYLYNNQ